MKSHPLEDDKKREAHTYLMNLREFRQRFSARKPVVNTWLYLSRRIAKACEERVDGMAVTVR